MPFVKIEIVAGKTPEYKKLLLQTVHDALVSGLEIPEDDRLQRLYELPPECFEYRETVTDKITLIELSLFPGRSKDKKTNVITDITRLLGERLSIPAGDIYIIINEPPLENWGLRGQSASDMRLQYKK
ncbi:MAG: tautomerase family protein [Oscillospiraceae bacterium]|nr:tautomerase family protein [Oscillospiraceae bacterium]